jgi:predicted RNA polymerase sigma factor
VTATDPERAIEAIWRIESTKIIAALTRLVRDVGIAEELAQDALVAALDQWPASGIPEKPAAWLMGTAKHRALDHFRRGKLRARKHDELAYDLETAHDEGQHDLDSALDDEATTCCASCSSPAIRCSPPKRKLRSPCGCWAA